MKDLLRKAPKDLLFSCPFLENFKDLLPGKELSILQDFMHKN